MAIHALSTGAPTCAPSARSNSPTHEDTSILAAFKRFQDAHAALQLVADDKPEPPETMTPTQARLWEVKDWAEDEVGRTPASTPEGIVTKLWLAIIQTTSIWDVEDAAARADFKWFDEQGGNIEWQTRLIVEAIRALVSMVDHQATPEVISAYWRAFDAYEAGAIGTSDYMAAFNAMHAWEPRTATDFVRKFEVAYSLGGSPTEENEARLIAQASALLGGNRAHRQAVKTSAVTSGLEEAIATYEQAQAESFHFDTSTYDPACAAGGLNIKKLARRSDELGVIATKALANVERCPVSTPLDLMRKIDVLRKALGDDDDVWGSWILADLRRIAGEA